MLLLSLVKHKFNKISNAGLALIEWLIIGVILVILTLSIITAVDPANRKIKEKDSRRSADIDSILTAVHEYIVDNKGSLPPGLSPGMAEKQLGTAGSGCAISSGGCEATDCVNLATSLTKYLKTIPIDPDGTVALTKYSIAVDVNNIVTVKACGVEGTTNISTSR